MLLQHIFPLTGTDPAIPQSQKQFFFPSLPYITDIHARNKTKIAMAGEHVYYPES